MNLFISEAIIDGFGPFEFDLATRLNEDPAQKPDLDTIIANIVDVLHSPNAGASLSVAGHADRDDTPNRSHIEHLAVEKDSSEQRVTNAVAHIHELVQQSEPTAPSDLNTLPFFDVLQRAPGAGVLVEDGASLTEDQRKRNRRVQVRLLVFKP
jgi:hypothetical protein